LNVERKEFMMVGQKQSQMKFDVEEPSRTQRILKVEVPAEEIEQNFQKSYRMFQKKSKIPGFRPGRAPVSVIRRRFGEEIRADLLQRLLADYFEQALSEASIQPVDSPIIQQISFQEGQPFLFNARVYVKPEFELKDYKGIPLTKKKIEVTDEMVDRVLTEMREGLAELSSYEDETHAVEKGDVIEADFEGTVDGEALEGGKVSNHLIEVGAGRMLPAFEEGLLGMKKGESREIRATYPEDFDVKHLAGKEGVFQVTLNDIKMKKLPELDDEFAKDVGEKFSTLDELKASIREKMLERQEKKLREELHLQLMDELLDRNPIEEYPEVMVERQKASLRRSMEESYENLEGKEDSKKEIDPELEKKIEEKARRDVGWSLIMEQIVEKEGMTVTAEEVETGLEKSAWEASMSKEVLRDLYVKQMGSLEPFRLMLLNEKVLDFLLENAKVTVEGGGEGNA